MRKISHHSPYPYDFNHAPFAQSSTHLYNQRKEKTQTKDETQTVLDRPQKYPLHHGTQWKPSLSPPSFD
jgi:hypothetical protein